jgi:hypothetical protein
MGQGIRTPHRKKQLVTKCYMVHRATDRDRSFGTTLAMENGYGIWNTERYKSLYTADLSKTVASELAKWKYKWSDGSRGTHGRCEK